MRGLRLAVAAFAALALAGCASAAPSATTSAPPPVSTAPAAPSEAPAADPAATELIVRSTGFELVDAAGTTVFTHAWADEVGPAVQALEAALGTPAQHDFQANGGGHFADFDLYLWPGLTFGDAVGLEKPRAEYFLPSWIEATVPMVNGLAIDTVAGVTVGSSAADAAAVVPNLHLGPADSSAPVYKIDPVDPALLAVEGESTPTVGLFTDDADTVVVSVKAPEPSRYLF